METTHFNPEYKMWKNFTNQINQTIIPVPTKLDLPEVSLTSQNLNQLPPIHQPNLLPPPETDTPTVQYWHEHCYSCFTCQMPLHNQKTFSKFGEIYCEHDYLKHFSPFCHNCHLNIYKDELCHVIKGLLHYHVKCLHCSNCHQQIRAGMKILLQYDFSNTCNMKDFEAPVSGLGTACENPGDTLAGPSSGLENFGMPAGLTEAEISSFNQYKQIKLICETCNAKRHSLMKKRQKLQQQYGLQGLKYDQHRDSKKLKELLGHTSENVDSSMYPPENEFELASSDLSSVDKNLNRIALENENNGNSLNLSLESGYGSFLDTSNCSNSISVASHSKNSSKSSKSSRIRTVLNEQQLHTLKTCYQANSRPDALMKEQLVEMTGLTSRVIRVWFQNKRCKDKKKTAALSNQAQSSNNSSFPGM